MNDKYYVVSKTELEDLVQACYDRANADAYNLPEKWVLDAIEKVNKTFDACCARPVPEWATEFATDNIVEEYADDVQYSVHKRVQELKR